MRRSIVSAILFVVAGIFYLIAAMKGNIPIYYIFSILLLLFGGLYIKRAFTEKKVEEESKIKNSNLDIGYIDGANHSYQGKEEILANEIKNFLINKEFELNKLF